MAITSFDIIEKANRLHELCDLHEYQAIDTDVYKEKQLETWEAIASLAAIKIDELKKERA